MSNAHTMGHERGAASLLVALVLMMSITLLTLAVAHTRITETRMAGNERWQKRLLLAAESAAETATAVLTQYPSVLVWAPANEDHTQVSRAGPVESAGGVETRVMYRRSDHNSPFVEIQAISSAQGGRGTTARVSEQVRLLTVLSPLAESAPPLVINGCLSGGAVVSIRPINSDSDAAGAALWRYTPSPCPALAAIDMHAGRGGMKSLDDTLWTTFFSISRDEYERLAASWPCPPPGGATGRSTRPRSSAANGPTAWVTKTGRWWCISPRRPAARVLPRGCAFSASCSSMPPVPNPWRTGGSRSSAR
jgi:hypothetical protein